jgi:hypothetical protein
MKALVLATVIFAQAPAETTAPNLTDAEAYARDVTLMVLYHEMGHALIDVLDAPVLGRGRGGHAVGPLDRPQLGAGMGRGKGAGGG